MFLKNRFSFFIGSVIVVGIFIYTFYDYIFPIVYCDAGHVNNEAIFNATYFSHLEAYLVVPVNGYDISDPTVFYHILLNKTHEFTFVHLHHGLAYAIRVDDILYTVHPNLIKLYINII
jgi:hypothetical protein